MKEKIEIIKHGTAEAIQEYDAKNDTRKNYRCKRCGCEWKCEYSDNIFGAAKEDTHIPAILCPDCNCNDTEEFQEEVTCGELDCANCIGGKCRINYHKHPQERLCREWVRC